MIEGEISVMARTATKVDENLFRSAVANAEKNGALKNLGVLYGAIVKQYTIHTIENNELSEDSAFSLLLSVLKGVVWEEVQISSSSISATSPSGAGGRRPAWGFRVQASTVLIFIAVTSSEAKKTFMGSG